MDHPVKETKIRTKKGRLKDWILLATRGIYLINLQNPDFNFGKKIENIEKLEPHISRKPRGKRPKQFIS